MARHITAVCRLCRREGMKLYLKGDRCYSTKCVADRKSYPPGQHGQARKKTSEYAVHLREKQKLRRIYGLMERQFERYFRSVARKKGLTGVALLQLLETRLDNVVYRLGIASSRAQARQLVMHGHIAVDGRKVDIPSYQLRPGRTVSVRPGSKDVPVIRRNIEAAAQRTPAQWLSFDPEKMEGRVLGVPAREHIDTPVQEHLIVEHYSR
ncbi:MAG: 30S ribosomal protein S4 [Firmicutes bacterium]|nr:30S ribosomal protein S4 [Bacillota bacterium]